MRPLTSQRSKRILKSFSRLLKKKSGAYPELRFKMLKVEGLILPPLTQKSLRLY